MHRGALLWGSVTCEHRKPSGESFVCTRGTFWSILSYVGVWDCFNPMCQKLCGVGWQQVNTGKILLPLKEELPPRPGSPTQQLSGNSLRVPVTGTNPRQRFWPCDKICSLLGGCFPINPKLLLPFFAGFLLLFSCPLTSCNRFSSSFFFSWANSSFDFAACFLPLAAVGEEGRVSESAGMQGERVDITILQGMYICVHTLQWHCQHPVLTQQLHIPERRQHLKLPCSSNHHHPC